MARLKAPPSRLSPVPTRIVMQTHDGPDRSRLRDATTPWRKWYKTARWKALRLTIFGRDLFTCQMVGCGRVVSNTSQLVCDHKRRHRGDDRLFWDERNLQTLCKPCHDGRKQAEERANGEW